MTRNKELEVRYDALLTDENLRTCFVSYLKANKREQLINKIDTAEPCERRELKDDIFPRFVRSKIFYKFMKDKNDGYLSTIGTIVRGRNLADTFLKHAPFSNPSIVDQDIEFLIDASRDRIELNCVSIKQPTHAGYFNEGFFSVLGDNSKFTIHRYTGHLPCSAKQFLYIFTDVNNRYEWDKTIKQRLLLDYFPASEQEPYSCVLMDYELKFPIGFQNRRNILMMTCVYDSKLKCYIVVGKSTTAHNDKAPPQPKNTMPWSVLFGYMFYEIDETKCYYVNITYLDFKLETSKLSYTVTRLRSRDIHQGFLSSIAKSKKFERPENHQRVLDTLDEFTEMFLTNDKEKTWCK